MEKDTISRANAFLFPSLSLFPSFFRGRTVERTKEGRKEGRKGVSREGKYTHAVTVYGREVGHGERLRAREREKKRAGSINGVVSRCESWSLGQLHRAGYRSANSLLPRERGKIATGRRFDYHRAALGRSGGDGARASALARSLARLKKNFNGHRIPDALLKVISHSPKGQGTRRSVVPFPSPPHPLPR